MKLALIVLIIPSCFLAGVVSAQDWSGYRYLNRNLEVCSSGIRGNACDHTSQHGSGDKDRVLQSLPQDAQDKMLYMSYVESMIATNFILPRGFYNNLSAIITFKISRDGNVTNKNLERRSGNLSFDMTAMQAIDAATPFGLPPRELTGMEIRVTFHP